MEAKPYEVTNSADGNSSSEASSSGGNGSASASIQPGDKETRAPFSLSYYFVELKELLMIALPITLSALLMQLIVMVSFMFCGHLGKDQLNAAAIAITIVNSTGFSIVMGLSTALDTLFSQAFGSANKKRVGVLLQRGVFILLLACFPCWAIFINTGNILHLIKLGPNIARMGQEFAMMAMMALPGFALFVCLSKYLYSQSIVIPSMIIGGISNIMNIGFHVLFVLGLKMDVRGASLAVGLSYWSVVVGHLLYIRVSRCYEKTWSGFQLYESLNHWDSFLHLAISGMFMTCLEGWGFELLVIIAGILGPTALAAHAVLYQFTAILFMIPLGLSTSACVRVGNYLGEGKPEEAKKCAETAIVVLWAGASVSIAILLSLRHVIPYIYTSDQGVANLSTRIIPIVALFHFCDASQCCASGILRGVGMQKFGAVVNVIAYYAIGIPVGGPLMLKTSLGIAGGWWAMVASTGFQAICFLARVTMIEWLAESEKAIASAHFGHHPEAGSEDDLYSSDYEVASDGNENDYYSTDTTLATSTSLGPRSTFGVEPVRTLNVPNHATLLVKRLVVVVIMVAIFMVGVLCYLFVIEIESLCIMVNATDLNATNLTAEHRDVKLFSELGPSEQRLLDDLYKIEGHHSWNTTFLICDGKIVSVGNDVPEL